MKIIGLYSGSESRIGPKNAPTGIFKQLQSQVVITALGIEGDIQVDKRVHGGPEKALHQYAHRGYEKIIKRFALMHNKALPGTLGENISATMMHDHNVCIGDIYQIGEVVLQVSGPRIPCWKIGAKFNQHDLPAFIRQHQITGWYYRVLACGTIGLGEEIILCERANEGLSIAHFMATLDEANADPMGLTQLSCAQGLDPQWKAKLSQ